MKREREETREEDISVYGRVGEGGEVARTRKKWKEAVSRNNVICFLSIQLFYLSRILCFRCVLSLTHSCLKMRFLLSTQTMITQTVSP